MEIMAYIISADELKKTLPGYSPNKSEAYHRESAKLADKQYAKAVKERSEPLVILMAGGTASGKSEYVSAYLENEDAIVLDGTLPSFDGANIKTALKTHKRVAIHCVLPESLPIAFVAFLNRDRKFGDEHFFRTHSATRKTILMVAEAFPDIPITIIMSSVYYVNDNALMNFRVIDFTNRAAQIEFLQGEQYTEDSIKQAVFKDYDL
jgi:hypothetical protein